MKRIQKILVGKGFLLFIFMIPRTKNWLSLLFFNTVYTKNRGVVEFLTLLEKVSEGTEIN